MRPRINKTLLALSAILSPLILWLLYALLYRLGVGVPDGAESLRLVLILTGVLYLIGTVGYLVVSGVNSGRL